MNVLSKKNIIILLASIVVVGLLFYAFGGEKEKISTDSKMLSYKPDSIPMMTTDSITQLISDSGLVRYKLLAKTWLYYDRVKEPYQLFPDKFYGEQFDTAFNVVVTVKADSVWNYTKKKLWILRGNVEIENTEGETFKSEELYWDERIGKIYSDKFVEITRPDKIVMKGQGGFEANQQMTEYEFRKVDRSEAYVQENTHAKEEEVEDVEE